MLLLAATPASLGEALRAGADHLLRYHYYEDLAPTEPTVASVSSRRYLGAL
jgi:hypothetical protein